MGLTVREATFSLLRDLGVTTVFGNPGSTEETFLKDFPDDFDYVLALQEASAVAMADAFTQMTGTPSVVNVHTGAGLTNAMSNILTAYQNKTPLLVTAGQQTRQMLLGEPWLTNVQPEVLPQPWVKWAYQPVRAVDVPAAFMRAYATAVQAPAGPVFLSVPLDDWDQPAASSPVVRDVAPCSAAAPDRVRWLAGRINHASDPVLIYGASLTRAGGWDHGVALAEKLNVPVWAAPSSERAPFPETHRLYAGGLPFAQGPLAERLAGHDLAVVVGAPVFRYYPWVPGPYLPDGLALVHVTDDPAEAARAPVGDTVLGDPNLVLEELLPLVSARPPTRTVDRQPHGMAPHPAAKAQVDQGRLSASDAFRVLRSWAPSDAVLVEESPSNLPDLHTRWPVTSPDGFFTFASGSLGWGLPAAVGVALADQSVGRDRVVVAVIGDGALQYSLQALWTAAQRRARVVIVVPRNDEYAILKSFAKLEETPGVPGLDIPAVDCAALARGYGVTAYRARTEAELRDALSHASEARGPVLIDVAVATTVPPLI